MRFQKLSVLLLAGAMLFGCSSSNDKNEGSKESAVQEIYKNLDAKQTYDKLVEKMNSEVTYFQTTLEDVDAKYYNQSFVKDGKVYIFNCRDAKETGDLYIAFMYDQKYNIVSFAGGESMNMAFHQQDMDEEMQLNDHVFNDFYNSKDITVHDLTREDKDGTIILTLKYTIETNDPKLHIKLTMSIGEDGLLATEHMEYYEDETYEKRIADGVKTKLSHYNEKTAEDADKLVEEMKSCDGLSRDEVLKKFAQ